MTARETYHSLPIASHGLPRHATRVTIGRGAVTARVIVVPMTRAVALVMADDGNTMARAMATPVVCGAKACDGSQL